MLEQLRHCCAKWFSNEAIVKLVFAINFAIFAYVEISTINHNPSATIDQLYHTSFYLMNASLLWSLLAPGKTDPLHVATIIQLVLIVVDHQGPFNDRMLSFCIATICRLMMIASLCKISRDQCYRSNCIKVQMQEVVLKNKVVLEKDSFVENSFAENQSADLNDNPYQIVP